MTRNQPTYVQLWEQLRDLLAGWKCHHTLRADNNFSSTTGVVQGEATGPWGYDLVLPSMNYHRIQYAWFDNHIVFPLDGSILCIAL